MDTLQQSYSYGKSPLQPDTFLVPQQTYLFGGKISHSLSPKLHSILFRASSASWKYSLQQTTSTKDFLEVLHRPDTIGASVTMPNKVTFMPLLDHVTEDARAIGAINTCFVRVDEQGRRKYIGTNTDCVGIRESLLASDPYLPDKVQGQPGLVIGGGGAARSAIYAIWKWFGVNEIYIVNRIKSEVDAIISSMERTVPGIKLRYVATVEQARNLTPPQVIIGTIPDEMPNSPEEKIAWDVSVAFIQHRNRTKGVLLDMCYHPNPNTRLCILAENYGWISVFGTDVLVRVSAAQQRLWLEREPTPEGVRQALLAIERPSAKI